MVRRAVLWEHILEDQIGGRIKVERTKRGWTQLELATRMGGAVKRATISDFESGRRYPSLKTIARFASLFRVHPASLLVSAEHQLEHEVVVACFRASPHELRAAAEKLRIVPKR